MTCQCSPLYFLSGRFCTSRQEQGTATLESAKCCCTRNKLNSQTSLVEQFAYITQEMGREEVLVMYSCATLDILTMQSRVRVVGWLRQWTTCGREPATRSPHPVTRAMIHHHHLLVVMRMTIREANSEVIQKRGAGGKWGSSSCMIKLNCEYQVISTAI